MRIPKYMSPSSLKTFERDREEYYLKYLADNRPDRLPQTLPMSVGSAFDAYVKSYLHKALHGNYGPNNEYELTSIFESQVEPHHWDTAWVDGELVFLAYSRCGALSNMLLDLGKAIGPPRFEFNIEGTIDGKIGHIPLLGKPDIFFVNEEMARVIWDWKVNGFYANSPTSPTKGYVRCVDTWSSLEKKASRNNGMPHKDAVLSTVNGIQINVAMNMEDCNSEWADQLAIYGWLLGEPIGSEELIVGIDQIVGAPAPYLRVAAHRTRVGANYQRLLRDRLDYAWRTITSGHIFTNLTRDESDAKIEELEIQAKALADADPMTKFVNRTSRGF